MRGKCKSKSDLEDETDSESCLDESGLPVLISAVLYVKACMNQISQLYIYDESASCTYMTNQPAVHI